MTKEELITKQQIEIEQFKQMSLENKALIRNIKAKFTNIGAPLNDNILGFNPKQINWCGNVFELIDQIQY